MAPDPSELHRTAVFETGLSDAERRRLCLEAVSLYTDPLDKARGLRDASRWGHRVHRNGTPTEWQAEMADSAEMIAAIDADEQHPREALDRELGATIMMHGRMLFDDAIQDRNTAGLDNARALLNTGMSILPTDIGRPDQYQINFAALQLIANRFAGDVANLSELRDLWAMSLRSENPAHVRHTAELPLSRRFAARGRASLRALVATTINYMPGQSPQPARLANTLLRRSRIAS